MPPSNFLGPCFYCHVESPINQQSEVVVPVIEDACEEEYKGECNLTYNSTIDNDIHGGSSSRVLGKKTIVSKSSRNTWYDKVQTCGNLIDH
ncbi:hypothetical protein H5410_008996 [Solanum commersonii]|uniref:Uncharacterized protein n=1 Tax=Solanum commersonii TaxID=4109 RepID=A0A9J6AI91_SOLCO|nr:hypothetical protein H5410_008996 [Solanum commersonii]